MEFKKIIRQSAERKYIQMLDDSAPPPCGSIEISGTLTYLDKRKHYYNRLSQEKSEFNNAIDSIHITESQRLDKEAQEDETKAHNRYKIFKALKTLAFSSPVIFSVFAGIEIISNYKVYDFRTSGMGPLWIILWVLFTGGMVFASFFLIINLFENEIYFNKYYTIGTIKQSIFSILIAAGVFALSIFFVFLTSSAIIKENDFVFTTVDGEYYLARYTGDSTTLNLPESCDGNQYHIASKTFKEDNIETVNIPNNVISIGENAFYHCTSLASVTIGNSVTKIEYSAFEGCASLASITIPNSVTLIEEHAFRNCISLTNITIPDSVAEIGNGAFSFCSSLKSITIPKNTTMISAFNGCPIENVTIPTNAIPCIPHANLKTLVINGGNEIENMAFSGCTSLTSITIPDSVTKIGYSAFKDCSSLANITISDSVTEIGTDAFFGCSSLQYNEYDNAYYLGNDKNPYIVLIKAKNPNITSCAINENAKIIYCYAFKDCTSLTSIIIPDSVASIKNHSFYGCTLLSSITIPDSITSIEYDAFNDCSSLTSITIPNSITLIASNTFKDCTSLTSVTIPDNVSEIGYNAFVNCTSLTSVTIPNNVSKIGYNAFYGCPIENATIPANAISHISQEKLKTVIINGGDAIGDDAFENCTSLISITIGDSITRIGISAFSGCTLLTSVTIPNSVTSIGDYAFYRCSSLASIIIPNSVISIGTYVFRNRITIYCETTSQPNDWDSYWSNSNYHVYWYSENQPVSDGNYWHYGDDGEIVIW